MDEFLTDGYSEPCGRCAAVDWGASDEGQFFCKNCHNVIEGSKDRVDESSLNSNRIRISNISRPKKTGKECGPEWMVCEGFQFILKRQADALVSLGVCMEFKTEVMWNFWMRYLQNTKQAFINNPISTRSILANKNSEVLNENSEVLNENSEVLNENSEVQNENTEVQNENTEVHNENTEVQNENTEVQNENTEVQNENTEVQNENTEVHNENTEVHNENSEVHNENTEVQNENSEVHNENTEVQNEPESMACSEEFLLSGTSLEPPASGHVKKKRSGSLDASFYANKLEGKNHNLMTMPRTLALLHLALLWVREAITLADLLRLVKERRVPYLNIYNDFPEGMELFGKDSLIFRVESIPSYSTVHKEAVILAKVMKLPAFPTISQDCLLHPIPLAVRYLLETNLPDELLIWVQKVIDENAMGNESFLTFNPVKPKPALLFYDIQAAAVIIVSMKLLFKLDDHVEWTLSGKAADEQKEKAFSLRRWYKSMQPAFERARQKMEREEARQLWKSSKPFITSQKDKSTVFKKRRVVEHLQHKFQKLTDSTPEQQPSTTTSSFSSFHFLWGEEESADGPSMHQHQLNCTMEKEGVNRLTNRKFWHTALRLCPHTCGNHFSEIESSLPRMYVWLHDLFSFLLGVSQAQVYKEVLNVERHFLKRKRPRVAKIKKLRPATKKIPHPSATKKIPPPSTTSMTLRSRKKTQ